jgi:hypothetical protein
LAEAVETILADFGLKASGLLPVDWTISRVCLPRDNTGLSAILDTPNDGSSIIASFLVGDAIDSLRVLKLPPFFGELKMIPLRMSSINDVEGESPICFDTLTRGYSSESR